MGLGCFSVGLVVVYFFGLSFFCVAQRCAPSVLCQNSVTCCVSKTLWPKTCDQANMVCIGPPNPYPDNGTVCVPSPPFYSPDWGKTVTTACCATEELVGCPYYTINPDDSHYSPCCLPSQTCCGNNCCSLGEECCSGICVSKGQCCSGKVCPTNSTCCGSTCCQNSPTNCCIGSQCVTSYGCSCDTGNVKDNICNTTFVDNKVTCCNPLKGCCAGNCCSGSSVCCSKDTFNGEKICVSPSECCNGITCPKDTFCCGHTCCENSGSCCFNDKCYTGPVCKCDTGIPTDKVCSITNVNTTKLPDTVECCDPLLECCGTHCCLSSSQVCCMADNNVDNFKVCIDPSDCCDGRVCNGNSSCCGQKCCPKSQACCNNICCDGEHTCCIDGKQCSNGFLCATNIADFFAMITLPIYSLIAAFLIFLCILTLCIVIMCKSRKWCLENKLKAKDVEEMREHEKMVTRNEKLEKKVEELQQLKEEKEEIVTELEKAKIENEELHEKVQDLEKDNEELIRKVDNFEEKVGAQELLVALEPDRPLGPIQLIFCGGSMLQEKFIMAPPNWKMDRVITELCSQQKMTITKYVFCTKPNGIHGEKIYVNYDLTAHENGFVNGTRIMIEQATNNSLWKREGQKESKESTYLLS